MKEDKVYMVEVRERRGCLGVRQMHRPSLCCSRVTSSCQRHELLVLEEMTRRAKLPFMEFMDISDLSSTRSIRSTVPGAVSRRFAGSLVP